MNLHIWPLDRDAAQAAKRVLWQYTKANSQDAARPRPASQMFKLLRNRRFGWLNSVEILTQARSELVDCDPMAVKTLHYLMN